MKSLAAYWTSDLRDAAVIPSAETQAVNESGGAAVYGEVTESGIMDFMDEVPFRHGNFVDLGSGRANVVAFVAANYGFTKCYGIEMSEARHRMAEKILLDVSANHIRGMERVHLQCGDLFDFNLFDMNVVFSDNLLFEDAGLHRMFCKVSDEMAPNTFFITARPAPDGFPRLCLEASLRVRTSWLSLIHI